MLLIKLMRSRWWKLRITSLSKKFVEYLGTDIAIKLPQIHAISKCDTTSFLNGVWKVKVLKKCLKKNRLLNTIGVSFKVSDTAVKDVQKFIQIVCYSGKEEECLTEISLRLYKQMKTKKLLSLYHRMISRSCKLLSLFTIKFVTGQE